MLPIIQNRNVWAAISLIAILLFTSGHMFNHIRKVPYVAGDGKGGVSYFASGFSNQYGLETQIVAAMCKLCPNSLNNPTDFPQTACYLLQQYPLLSKCLGYRTLRHNKSPCLFGVASFSSCTASSSAFSESRMAGTRSGSRLSHSGFTTTLGCILQQKFMYK